jgi:uncharacterized heparinase superfamily protein
MTRDWIGMVKRGLRKPPKVILQRLHTELQAEADRFVSPLRARRFGKQALLKATGDGNFETLWQRLSQRPFPAYTSWLDASKYDHLCPGDKERILKAADFAVKHQVDLLGSGLITLGTKIDWYKDYKTGFSWQPAYIRSIEYNNLDRPSDVKIPWEISRLQWLIPAGQAYLLTGDERYAIAARNILEDWITSNPYAHSVNWACTMEVALRILSWTWFFHVFHRSKAWTDTEFRERFLSTLFLHGEFTERHLERSDINGNHFTADAAGLVFAGLFFNKGDAPNRWQNLGWNILCEELPRQVFPDGVDFEASVPYHRLVLELFLLPALFREACGLDVRSGYRERIIAMARFTATYSRPDGTVPLWGDADDARALPFGGQPINDHRYLPGLVGVAWNVPELCQCFAGSRSEIFWLLGAAVASLPNREKPLITPSSTAFPDGGFYVMCNERDRIFIDCGPLGLAGRGGHGHNDCLSFEAVLDGVHLISDCGAYLYTASYKERNNFRSTAYHNTPQVDGEEINRFIHPDYLWNLHNDALPEVRRWEIGSQRDVFCGSHSGYQRLAHPVRPVRTIILDHTHHALVIQDVFEGEGEHIIEIPFHLAPGTEVHEREPGKLHLRAHNRDFVLVWGTTKNWALAVDAGRVSPSYGVVVPTVRLAWRRRGGLEPSLLICLLPMNHLLSNPLQWALGILKLDMTT